VHFTNRLSTLYFKKSYTCEYVTTVINTICVRFDGVTKNFKLYYDNQHYVGEKRFDTMQDLVADGLITFYLESKAADYIASLSSESNYAESPYVAYNTQKKFQMAAASGPCRAGKPGASDVAANQRPVSVPMEDGAVARGGRAANIPVERSRLSQIAEARRSQESAVNRASAQAGRMSPQAAGTPAATPAAGKPHPHRQSAPANQRVVSPSSRYQPPTVSSQNATDTAVSTNQDVRTSSATNTDGPVGSAFLSALFSTPCLKKKTKQICFCQNCVKFPPILIIFSRKMANDTNICEVHSFSTSPNLRHHLTVLNANVPNCYITPTVMCNKLLKT